jgi:hypothetical protein
MTGGRSDERPWTADRGHTPAKIPRVYFDHMSSGNDNQVDWSAASTPGEGVVPSLSRSSKPKPRVLPTTKSGVMDTLLGENNLSAHDAGGNDPYNATGRQFRR